MPETRKFAQGLKRKDVSSTKRESLQPIRNSVYSDVFVTKPGLTDPIEYEAFIMKKKSEINHDSLRDLLVFPQEDVVVNKLNRELRTVVDTVPQDAMNEASSLMVQECIKNYSRDWEIIEKKFEAYGDDYLSLPKTEDNPIKSLPVHVFEVDKENNLVEEDAPGTPKQGLTKRGWLYKAPDYGIANASAKSFKRRFCHLLQLQDSSYSINYYKDEKISKDPKGAVYLDSCIGAFSVSNKGKKYCFEIRMQDQNCHLFAGETETDANDWILTINMALQNTIEAQKEKYEHDSKLSNNTGDGDLVNLKSSMHPELRKYSKETEQKNSADRKKNRQKILNICPDFQNRFFKTAEKARKRKLVPPPPMLSKSKHRVFVDCKTISFSLRGVVIDGVEEPITNLEPFFVSLSLFDVAAGKKISGDLHVDLNHPLVRNMIPNQSPGRGKRPSASSEECQHSEPNLNLYDVKWLAHPKKGIFTVSKPHTDIYLVVRIEKVLQGSIKSCVSPYMRVDSDNHKTAAKVLKHARLACHRLGQYRMPFAWTAKQLFADDKGRLNNHRFDLVYKQDASKLAEEDLLKILSDFKRQEKLSKLEFIDCELQVNITPVPTDLPNILTSSLLPIKPFELNTLQSQPVFEVDEFMINAPGQHSVNMEYINHCYIYPKSLNYDSQKSFAKARNIAVVVEFRDAESSIPLCTFYKKPGPPGSGVFCARPSAAILHHQEKPEFYEEWKLLLPTQLHHGHHIVFTFYHVVVDTNSKKKDLTNTEVGQAFLPLLLKDGRLSTGDHQLPVATALHPGYMSVNETIGRHGQEIKWVDGGKNLFRVGISLVSSVYTDDQHIHNFFEACSRFHSGSSHDTDITKYLKSLLACELGPLIRFLPTLLKQLFFLFTADRFGSDVETFCMKTLVNIVATCHAHGHDLILQQYIKYMFVTSPWKDYKCKTIHEELATAMTNLLRPTASDFLTSNKLLLHFSFFLQILIKSMVQHLMLSEKIKLNRTERFPISFQHAIQSLLNTAVPHIVKKWKTNYTEAHSANLSLARFVRECFSYVDRGFVFKLINTYCRHFNDGDPKVLFEFKFEFLREVCNHEHYIPLNLPFACSSKSGKNVYSYCLTEDYCSAHFLSGLLLKSVCDAMNESPDIRMIAIEMFRNLLAKHSFDDRYQDPARQSRIATLYLPFLRIVLDNVGRFPNDPDSHRDHYPSEPENGETISMHSRQTDVTSSPAHLPPPGNRAGSLRMRVADSSLMSTIANPGSTLLVRTSHPSLDNTSLNSSPANKTSDKFVEAMKDCPSLASTTRFYESEILDPIETRSLLLCFLYVIDSLPNAALLGFWKESNTDEQIDFFHILILCLRHFRYSGKKQQFNGIKFGSLSKMGGSISRSFPARIRSSASHLYKNVSVLSEPMVRQASHMVDDSELEEISLLEANLSTEAGKIVLDVTTEFLRHHKKQILSKNGDNPLTKKLFDVLLSFLQISQSEEVLRHVFATFRLVLYKFSHVLFRGSADLCASWIYHALKCCSSSLASTRSEACALLYLLMRKNFESSTPKNFVRSQLQMIKAVSQLISEEVGIGSSQFQHSLTIINTYAISDKDMQKLLFPDQVKDLTKKIRTVLSATAAMKEHRDDPEMLIDLQCSLAKSYSSTPELRKTWLESMARTHKKQENYSEAAMCYVHIAALVAEYLKRKGDINRGCSAFRAISQNVEKEESSIKEDTGMHDVQYTEDLLVGFLETCADSLQTAERYELLAPIYNMIIPYFEKKRHYQSLIAIYTTLKEGYEKVVEVNRNGKRLLGTYFRVAFYGQNFFEGEHEKEYIYKEPKLTQLSEISQRLIGMYQKKFGKDNVRLIQESGKVNVADLDPKLAYIQVTYVLPYFDTHEREQRKNYFEQHHNVRNFMFETPFTPGGRARGDIEEQWKRKSILTTSHCFPYIAKRIPVTSNRSYEMKPIEVALDEMTSKCDELDQLVSAEHIDLKKLQLRLQGSVNVQVNAGPLAYARAFLCDDKIANYAANTVELLRQVYRRFVILCSRALYLNEQLITSNQRNYHESLQQCYHAMVDELSQILHDPLLREDDDNISVTTAGPDTDTSLSKRMVAGSVSDSSNV